MVIIHDAFKRISIRLITASLKREDEIYHMYDDLYLKVVKLRHIEKKHKVIGFNDDSDERGILINYHNIKKYYQDWIMRIYYPSNNLLKFYNLI